MLTGRMLAVAAVAVFGLVVINESRGRWGIGPVMSFATNDNVSDAFAAGPAIGGVWQYSKKLNLGLYPYPATHAPRRRGA